MDSELKLQRLIEYSICEYSIYAYKKSKSDSTTFHSFCERRRESIIDGRLTKWEQTTLLWIMNNTNKIYCYPEKEFDNIVYEFFITRKWDRYYKAIRMMDNVKFSI